MADIQDYTEAIHAATQRIASRGLLPGPLASVTVTPLGTAIRPLDVWGGYVWGTGSSGGIYRAPINNEDNFTLYAPHPSTITGGDVIVRLRPTVDGEVIAMGSHTIAKSTGWSSGSPTWNLKATANGASYYLWWGIAGDSTGTKFITSEYGATYPESRYCRMSLDGGNTWFVAYDTETKHGKAAGDLSHLHGVCYDEWADRFYLSEGHGAIAGLYCSTDNGQTWSRSPGLTESPAPTVIVATPDGLVCGADSANSGLFGVTRRDNPNDEVMIQTWSWREHTGETNTIGFGRSAAYDPETGVAYIGFTTERAEVPPIIAAGTPVSGVLAWEKTDGHLAYDAMERVLLTPKGLRATLISRDGGTDGNFIVRGKPTRSGARSLSALGGVAAGRGTNARTLAVGPRAATGGADSIAIGFGTSTTSLSTVAIGNEAVADAEGSIAIGRGATGGGIYGVAVGRSSKANSEGVAVGWGSEVTNPSGTAIGRGAKAGTAGTAIGRMAVVSGSSSVGIGHNATVTHANTVVFSGSTTVASTASNQVQLGARHMEIGEIPSNLVVAAADSARLFVCDNGAGLTSLRVRFPSGSAMALATEGGAAGAVKTGTATLVAGTVTVADTAITANSIIRVWNRTIGGTPGAPYVSAKTAGTSFAITSTNAADTSVVYYEVVSY